MCYDRMKCEPNYTCVLQVCGLGHDFAFMKNTWNNNVKIITPLLKIQLDKPMTYSRIS